MRWIDEHVIAFRIMAVFLIVAIVSFVGGALGIQASESRAKDIHPGAQYDWTGPLLFNLLIALTIGFVAVLICASL